MSSSSRKRLVQWSPHNKSSFIVGSNDVRLYSFKYKRNNDFETSTNAGTGINNNNNNNNNNTDNSSNIDNNGIIESVTNNNSNNNIKENNIVDGHSLEFTSKLKQNTRNKYAETFNFNIEYPPDDWEPQEKKTISLISINSEVQSMKCMSWCPDETDQNLVACGLTNGRTLLTSFSSVNRALKELVPKHTRACNAITWNPVYKNQIAVGLDKIRADTSTLVWDINYLQSANIASSYQSNNSNNNNNITNKLQRMSVVDQPYSISRISDNIFNTSTDSPDTIYQPIAEFTQSEATLALAWLPNNPSCLLVGTGSKWLKIYDIRDINNVQSVMAHQKSVNGVCVDPFDCNRIATMSEDSHIKIWDLRNIDEPVMIVNSNCKSIQQIEWCPTRSGVLASVGKDKTSVKLWDIKAPIEYSKSPKLDRKSSNLLDLNTISKPTKSHHSKEIISSFSWHPTNECRMIIVSYSGVLEAVSLNENIPISWSPMGSISFSFGNSVIEGPTKNETLEPNLNSDAYKNLYNDGRYDKDISLKIKERAILGYSAECEENVNLAPKINDENINFLWNWIQKVPIQIQNHKKKINTDANTPGGITSPLSTALSSSSSSSDIQNLNNDYIGIYHILTEKESTVESQSGFLIHKSNNRFLCASICGWGFNQNLPLENMLSRLEKNGEYERAAAMAVFHLDIKRAMLVLTNAVFNINPKTQLNHQNHCITKEREFSLKVLSIALAGFGGDQHNANANSIWRDACKSTAKSFTDPYLKTCLEFLCSSSDSREIYSIIDDSLINLDDKIAFSCRYLDSKDLINFVEKNTARVIESGNLRGVLLTGLTSRGVDLLQNYIDKTSDIQTAVLSISMVVPKIFRDKRVTKWLSIYSDLLDNWGLWHQRAILDIQRINSVEPPPQPQIFAKCGYCQNSFSFESVTVSSMLGRNASNRPSFKARVPFCPHCKQSLPRCCLCLLPLNCMVPSPDFKRAGQPLQPTPAQPPQMSLQQQRHHHLHGHGPPHHINSQQVQQQQQQQQQMLQQQQQQILQQQQQSTEFWSAGSEPFDDWFTWCQTCRHGGHSQHILDWFKDHITCPVTDCTCKCSSL
ncbi:hypothetical protein DICPUDRAFT_147940 [Dictyostelium purpureum]|uniref:Uncharacterized protein n=1 Tax=Dictyostelium purpureum TaxID=5786 RepID=F0Z9T9_DICPU|nr:uncharacterized protein DICPUDRAFT_147940 [Dictyostelium purpureum]EGC39299.1 hypothetical protein DICPUDRAFT_147940 [Dictyostelium purpureum]|eukprot:XP_003284203.1 hypothetical protein DICPUDRAFT_147940 [Dictyostelium purpureum]